MKITTKKPIAEMSKAEIAELRAHEISHKLSRLDAIREYYTNELPIKLKPEHERARLIYIEIIAMLQKGRSAGFIVNKIRKDHDLHRQTGYKYIREATALFGDINRAEKEGVRALTYEMAKRVYRKAMAKGDYSEANRALANMIKIYGLNETDPDLPDFAKLDPSLYVIVMEDETRAMINKMLEAPSVDLSNLMDKMAEDAEIEQNNTGPDKGGNKAAS